jgi:hypothetical protein
VGGQRGCPWRGQDTGGKDTAIALIAGLALSAQLEWRIGRVELTKQASSCAVRRQFGRSRPIAIAPHSIGECAVAAFVRIVISSFDSD